MQHTQFVPYRNLCSDSHVIVGRGFVGTAFDSSCTVWHTDVNQVPEVSHLARGLHSRCMAAIPVVLAPSDMLGGGLDLGGGMGLGGCGGEGDRHAFVLEVFFSPEISDAEAQRAKILDVLTALLNMGKGTFKIGIMMRHWTGEQAQIAGAAVGVGGAGARTGGKGVGGVGNWGTI